MYEIVEGVDYDCIIDSGVDVEIEEETGEGIVVEDEEEVVMDGGVGSASGVVDANGVILDAATNDDEVTVTTVVSPVWVPTW